MRIIILGATQIGINIAEFLLIENNDITIVDKNELSLFQLQDRLDLRVVIGYESRLEVLREAGAEQADILISATCSDEMNIVACQIAYSFFSIPKCIAVLKSTDYIEIEDKIFPENQKYINFFIHPEKMIIKHLIDFIEYPGILKVIYLFNDTVVLSLLRIFDNSSLVGSSIVDIKNKISGIDFFIPIIIRDGIPFFSIHSTVFKLNDEFFILCLSKHFLKLIKQLRNIKQTSNKNIMLVGGGNIGFGIARILERKCNIKILELNEKRAKMISKRLEYSTVLLGNASDIRLFAEENIGKIDIFISVTNNDDTNIISSIVAKKMGSKQSLALVKNEFYSELINFSKKVDEIIFPQEIIMSELLNRIRSSNIISLFLFHTGKMEVIEIIVREKNGSSLIIGTLLSQITLPPGVIIFAIIRYNNLIIFDHFDDIRIEEEDHIIMLCTNRISIKVIEKLF
ncbi:Trk system potassium transporter TrkA [Buchnera aphidicola (Pemphigus obesinymphae)]|uniref:Trk system potassium transporter TrkA n=1 Tax=Buchnera aphidicola TaxID=9 RepID=UPI00223851EF|nr:Trk system potassium transporter TrkA [Buchnera aphidicola]MCW5196394.1 Trk system potassium transporter TrkA [Buchnera aphidicola (Pemphigus obesinymphae)]